MIAVLLLSVFLPGADIVVAPDAVDSTRFAAQELADHLKLVTGAESAIVTEARAGKDSIFVGYSSAVAAAGFTTNDLRRQAFRIAFRPKAVYLFGHDVGGRRDLKTFPWMFHFEEHGSLYAVYDFLRDWCGVEWFDPTDAGTTIRENPRLEVTGKDETREPFIRCRDAGPLSGVIAPELWWRNSPGWTNFLKTAYADCWREAKDAGEAIRRIEHRKRLFNLRMKGGGEYMHANHSFYGWYERFLLKNHPNFEAYHPEWFARGYCDKKGERGEITADWDGTKEPPQLCYSNPGVVAQAVKDARDYFDKGGSQKRWRGIGWLGWTWGENCYCIEPMDNSAFCQCDACKAQYDPQRDKERSAYSRYWFTFVNKVAAELAKSHPDKFLSTLAYGDRDGLPEGVEIAPNVIVHFCFSWNRTPYSREGFKRQLRQFKDWHAKYPDRDIGLWLYNTFPQERTRLFGGFHCFPGYFANTLEREYRLFKSLNVRACIFNCGFVDDFENYLSYRWMWNPDEPLAGLKAAYFARYGAAGEPLRKFYELVEKTYCDPSNYESGQVHQDEFTAWGRLGVERVMKELAGYAEAALGAEGLTAQERRLVDNWKAGVWDYMTSGNVKKTPVAAGGGVRCEKTKWLGRRPEKFEGNVIADSRFSEPFYNGPREGRKIHWRRWDGEGCSRFRLTVDRSDALRARCRFRVVGEKDGEMIAFTDFLGESGWQNWHSATPESVSYTTFDFCFDHPVAEGCTKIGIEDDSPSQDWNWPRYQAIEAAPDSLMRRDTLGLFIHWGLYSIPALGEWHLWRDQVPLEEYNRLAERFAPPASFSPREWVRLARRAGARYAVLTTRHHDGYCLFDTATTDFNSVKGPAHRDFVREFVEACRAEGLRVGLYFSIMNWQYYPRRSADFDERIWNEQVRTTHEALRELMTNYGKIDYLWYDGCRAPGGNDADYMERSWHIADLNAMVRKLQPDILINDRAMTPGDYATPEQSLAAPPRGRAWESCITLNGWWGYRADDTNWKSSETLFRSLLHCVRHGGNLLVNIGPRADGSVPEGCIESLEGLGEKIRECPESIYGAVRDDQTEATREGGVVTRAGGAYWFWALETNRLDGVATMEQRGQRAWKVTFKEKAVPCRCLGKRHDLDLAGGAAPILGDTSGQEAPPTGDVEMLNEERSNETEFTLPAGGEWRLETGYLNGEGFRDTDSREIKGEDAGEKVKVEIPGAHGIYARRMSPVWRAVPPKAWLIAGVRPTDAVKANFTEASVREVFSGDLVALAKSLEFTPVPEANDRADKCSERLSFVYSAPVKPQGMAFAKRTIRSSGRRSVYAALGCDWWGKVYVNGREALGYGSGWKPRAFRLDLEAGDNEILVACHGGSGQHWFTFYVNE